MSLPPIDHTAAAANDQAPLRQAEALLRQADTLARAMRLPQALEAIEQAAEIQRAAGAQDAHRRSSLLAAETARLLGQFERSRRHAGTAIEGADPDPAMAAQAHALLAAADLAQGDAAGAEVRFGRAIDAVPGATAPAWWQMRAQARLALGRAADAALDLEAAAQRCREIGDGVAERQAAVQAACAWHAAGQRDAVERVLAGTEAAAQAAGDAAALGSAAVLRATLALEAGDAAAARTRLLAAREHALAARAPETYIAAASGLAQLAEQAGDRTGAYAALATGWATVSDLLGAELARGSFEPPLRALRERWGAAAFAAARAAYEAQRRGAQPAGA